MSYRKPGDKRWEKFEEYLFERDLMNEEFNCHAVAEDLDVPPREATHLIQAYLVEQTKPDSEALFCLTRRGRTKTAIWHCGVRSQDARGLSRQTADDLRRRFERYVQPSLRHIGVLNGKALPVVNALDKTFEAHLELLEAALTNE